MSLKEGPQLRKPLKPPKPIELPAEDCKYRFELSLGQIFLRSFVLILALGWMFSLGVLVGRGLPLVGSTEESLRAQFFKLLGLAREPEQPVKDAANTWEEPENMLKALDYHEALTKSTKVKEASLPPLPKKKPVSESHKENPPEKKEETKQTAQLEKTTEKEPTPEESTEEKIDEAILPEEASGPYSFLVASLRTPEYAERLVEKLKAKGYSPRIEVIKMAGGKQWHRVILGSFEDNTKATKFAAQFNQKEKMQGMVIKGEKAPASSEPKNPPGSQGGPRSAGSREQ